MFQHFYFSHECLLLDGVLSTPIPPLPASLRVSFPSWKSEKPQNPRLLSCPLSPVSHILVMNGECFLLFLEAHRSVPYQSLSMWC